MNKHTLSTPLRCVALLYLLTLLGSSPVAISAQSRQAPGSKAQAEPSQVNDTAQSPQSKIEMHLSSGPSLAVVQALAAWLAPRRIELQQLSRGAGFAIWEIENWSSTHPRPGCSHLKNAAVSINPHHLVNAPLYTLRQDLLAWVESLRNGAQACIEGRYFAAEAALAKAARTQRGINRTLASYQQATLEARPLASSETGSGEEMSRPRPR